MLRGSEEGLRLSFYDHADHARLPGARRRDNVGCWLASRVRDGPQGIARNDFLDGLWGAGGHQDWRPRRVAKPVTTRRRDAKDFRPWPIVRHGFLLNRIDVARDDASIHVQPELALVNPANAAQADLPLADLAIAGTRRAHDLVRALDRLPELGDLPHRLARRLPDIEDFCFRNHRLSVHWSYRVKTLCESLPNAGRTEGFPALRQERFPPGFRHEDVAAGCRDLADHGEPSPVTNGRVRVPRQHRLDRFRPNRREELVVASVIQDKVLRDRGWQRCEALVPRQRGLVDLVREFRHPRHL